MKQEVQETAEDREKMQGVADLVETRRGGDSWGDGHFQDDGRLWVGGWRRGASRWLLPSNMCTFVTHGTPILPLDVGVVVTIRRHRLNQNQYLTV